MRENGSKRTIVKPDLTSGDWNEPMSLALHTAPRTGTLRTVLDWLIDARTALARPAQKVSGMSERDLRDIGLKPRSLTSTVYREIGKPGLVDFNWRLGR